MDKKLKDFEKTKEYLVCVDSDGCVFDTMYSKHVYCIGPGILEEWDFTGKEAAILERWKQLNLYTMNRGVNRFKGLALIMRELWNEGLPVGDVEALEAWVTESQELSEVTLAKAIDTYDSEILRKTLSWSRKVNEKIKVLPNEYRNIYEGAEETLSMMHELADVAVISTANRQSLEADWGRTRVLKHVDALLDQNAGSKEYCIQELLKKGYDKEKVVMIGDSPGDHSAAEKNGVYFYPINVRYEKESWEELKNNGFLKFLNGSYGGAYQEYKLAEFRSNLNDSMADIK